MQTKDTNNLNEKVEKPDEWWYRVYAAVIITTFFVILALWFFSKYFSG